MRGRTREHHREEAQKLTGVPHRAIAFEWDSVGREIGWRGLQLASMDNGFRLSSHESFRLLWRTCYHWRLGSTLGLLLRLHVISLVHLLGAPRRPCSRHFQRSQPVIASKIGTAQVMIMISWCTYPIAYLFPMLGFSAAKAVVSIQLGYCASDIICKCDVGLVSVLFNFIFQSYKLLLMFGGSGKICEHTLPGEIKRWSLEGWNHLARLRRTSDPLTMAIGHVLWLDCGLFFVNCGP